MSQEKVDRYKEQKANRKKLMEQEKRRNRMWKAGSCVVALALVAWIGFSAYDRLYEPPRKFYEVDTSAIDTYVSDLNAAQVVDEAVDAVDETLGNDEETEEAASEAVSEEETAEEEASEEEASEEETGEEASEEETAEQTTEAASEADTEK